MSRLAAHGPLAAILLLALLLRVIFFVGLVSGDPQDDGIYYGNALALYERGPVSLQRFRDLPPDFLANPIDQFHVRPMVTYPIAASFALFGPGELAAALWGLVCSLLIVLVVYRLGVLLHDRSTGLVAALLCAFYPLEVINGTRILSDVQVGLFMALGLLLLAEGAARTGAVWYGLAGVSAGAAYLANARGLIVLLVLAGASALQVIGRRTSWRSPLRVAGGFAVVFGLEALAYYLTTGDPLLSYRIQSGASLFKYLHEPVATFTWSWLRISYTNGQPWELVRTVFLQFPRPTSQFGVFFFLFLAAAAVSLLQRRNLWLLATAAALALYLEFGPVRVAFTDGDRLLHYMMVFKQERFLLVLTAPLVVVAADFLRALGRRSRLLAGAVLIAVFVTSLTAIGRTREHYRAGLHDLRVVAEDVRANPDRVFFGDFWAIEHLKIFTGYAGNLRVLDQGTPPDRVTNACVMVGGSRGVELLAGYVEGSLPEFARELLVSGTPPEDWRLVREVRGTRSPQRTHDFRLYCRP